MGDVVSVELRLDRATREVPEPPELRAALESRPRERKVFQQMGRGTRRQLRLYILAAKSPEVRRKRVARFLEILVERALLSRQPRPSPLP